MPGRPPVRWASAAESTVTTAIAPAPSIHCGPMPATAQPRAASPATRTASASTTRRCGLADRPRHATGAGAPAHAAAWARDAPWPASPRCADPWLEPCPKPSTSPSRGPPMSLRTTRTRRRGYSRRFAREGLVRRAAASASRRERGLEDRLVRPGLGEHVAERIDHHRVPAVARGRLADRDDVDGVLDGPGPHEGAPVVDLAVAGDPRRGHDQHLGTGVDQRTGELGEAQVVAGHQAHLEARHLHHPAARSRPRGAGRTRGSRTSRRGGSCGSSPRRHRGPAAC